MSLLRDMLTTAPDPRVVKSQLAFERFYIAATALVAAAVLAAWFLPGVGALLRVGVMPMKANAAVAILCIALSLALTFVPREGLRTSAGRLILLVPIALAVSALAVTLGMTSFGLETALAADAASRSPGVMSVETAVFILAVCVALLLDGSRALPAVLLADTAAALADVAALVTLAQMVLVVSGLFATPDRAQAAPAAVVCFVLVAAAVMSRRTRHGLFSVIPSRSPGGRVARAALPVAISVPFVLVIVEAALRQAGMDDMDAASLIAAVTAALMLGFVVAVALHIGHLSNEVSELSLTDELTGLRNGCGLRILGEQLLLECRAPACRSPSVTSTSMASKPSTTPSDTMRAPGSGAISRACCSRAFARAT